MYVEKNDTTFLTKMDNINITMSTNFYEVLDNVFDALFKKEGKISDELIQYKSQLIDVYENEDKYKSKEILKCLTPINWYIDEEGCFKVIEKKD